MDWYTCRAIEGRGLLFIYDGQHHIRRVDQENKFQGRCWWHPTHNQNRSGSQSRILVHVPQDLRIQSVVPGNQKPSYQCTFSGHGQGRQQTNPNSFYTCSFTGANFFQNCTPSQQICILDEFASAEAARKSTVQQSTHNDHSRLWKWWVEYCNSTGLTGDDFLTDLNEQQQTHFLSCFIVAVHEGRFLQPSDAPLASGTVTRTMSNVAATFRSHGYNNPTRDCNGNLDWNLSRQYWA
jgi:hypothetical protein